MSLRKRAERRKELYTIKADNWVEALFKIVLLIRSGYGILGGSRRSWIKGITHIFEKAESRGYDLSAVDVVPLLLSKKMTDEEVGIYLAAVAEDGWIKFNDFSESYMNKSRKQIFQTETIQ